MPCMCGDVCCSSCGPAQGNSRCPICGEWASEGCIHFNSRTGELKVRYRKQAEKLAKAEAEGMAQAYADEQKMIEEAGGLEAFQRMIFEI